MGVSCSASDASAVRRTSFAWRTARAAAALERARVVEGGLQPVAETRHCTGFFTPMLPAGKGEASA